MYPAEFEKCLSRGDIAPLYFFTGGNSRLIEEKISRITDHLFGDNDPALNLNYFDAQTHTPPEIVQTAQTIPFASPKRLIIVRRVHTYKAKQLEKFKDYFTSPSGKCCLICLADTMPLKGALLTAFKKHGHSVSFANPRNEEEVKPLIREGFKRHGKRIAQDALQYLAENICLDTRIIANELEKIALYCGKTANITLDDIIEVLSGGSKASVFQLVDAIGGGNSKSAVQMLNGLLDDGMQPAQILGMISRQFRLVTIALAGIQEGDSIDRIGRRLGLKYTTITRKIINQAKRWPGENLVSVFNEISRTDFLLKSSRINKKLILENLIFKLGEMRSYARA